MNFFSAQTKLGKKDRRKVANNTYLERISSTEIGLKLHNTFILRWTVDGDVILNSGGWRTVTTKGRINHFVEGIYIFQKDFQWYVEKYGQQIPPVPFHDGMIYNPEQGIR